MECATHFKYANFPSNEWASNIPAFQLVRHSPTWWATQISMVTLGSRASSEKLSHCVQAGSSQATLGMRCWLWTQRLKHKAHLSVTSPATVPIWPFTWINGQPFYKPLSWWTSVTYRDVMENSSLWLVKKALFQWSLAMPDFTLTLTPLQKYFILFRTGEPKIAITHIRNKLDSITPGHEIIIQVWWSCPMCLTSPPLYSTAALLSYKWTFWTKDSQNCRRSLLFVNIVNRKGAIEMTGLPHHYLFHFH